MNSVKTLTLVILISLIIIALALKTDSLIKSKPPESLPPTISKKSEIQVTSTPLVYKTQTNDEAKVEVTVTPVVLEHCKQPKFKVSINTHSVNLDFDISKVAVLTDNYGNSLGPATWEGNGTGGHHRNGILTFQNPLSEAVKEISLNFKDIAGIAVRTFEEEVKF